MRPVSGRGEERGSRREGSSLLAPLTFHLIPHTHWDREWYLPRASFQARLVGAVADLLALLESDPSARFVLDGQTVLVEDALAVRPDWSPRLEAAVRRGQLEVGPWYVLADELIPSGESLLRNLLLGDRDARRLGGRLDLLYSPDAFGHPAALPALAREFAIRSGVLWRGLGRPLGADRDLYRWIAPDGTGLLLYHLPAEGYEVGAGLVEAGDRLPERWGAIRERLVARAGSGQVAVFVGADHHAPPHDLASLRDRLQALEPEHRVRVSGLAELFAALEQEPNEPPEVAGELRRPSRHAWILQGVHATRSRAKRLHARAELVLERLAEPLAALAAAEGGADPRPLLELAWRTLVQSQFHDTLGGCCADQVTAEQAVRLRSVIALAGELARGAVHRLTGHDPDAAREAPETATPALALWNPVPRERSGVVTAEVTWFRRDVLVGPPSGRTPRLGRGYRPFRLLDAHGAEIPVQVLGVRRDQERLDAARHYPDQDEVDRVFVAFRPPLSPGMGLSILTPRPGRRAPLAEDLTVGTGILANRWVSLLVSPTGELALENRRTGERYTGLLRLEDEADLGDTYTFCPRPGSRPLTRATAARAGRAVVADGPLVGAVETRWSQRAVGGGVGCRLLVVLHADSRLVRLRLDLDHRAADHRLRARLPLGALGVPALAGAAFGAERRAPVPPREDHGPSERPVATAPAHRFVAAASGQRGLALFAPGFFEYEWTAKGDLLFTLLRAVGQLSRGDLPTRPGHAGWPQATPLAQELGRHTIELALAAVSQDDLDRPDRLVRLWEDAFLPIQGFFLREYSGRPSTIPSLGVQLEGEGLVFSALKPAESGDGVVLRCYNATESWVQGAWHFARPIRRAVAVRGDETEVGELKLRGDRTRVRLTAAPRQMASVLVVW